MVNKLDRFKKRQELKNKNLRKNHELSKNEIDKTLVSNLLNSEIDKDQIFETENNLKERFEFSLTDTSENADKVNELLASLSAAYDKKRLELLLIESKNAILDNIIKPFGIAKYVIAKYDKDGGNVDTIHNVRNNLYANEKEKQKGENIPEYNTNEYHSDEKYINENREGKEKKDNNQLIDEYTGKVIKKGNDSNLDHTISASEIQFDKGRILADLNGVELANSQTNLNPTNESINKSKGAKSMNEFVDYLNKTKESRDNEIEELSQKSELTDQERKTLKRLNELNEFDKELALSKDKKARKEYEKKISAYYKSNKFINETIKTSTVEGAKMGLQQAVGVVLKELTESIFDEISDIYHNGFKGENKIGASFFQVLKERLLRISNRILIKWTDVVKAFGEGFFSGFLSNIVTVVINMFVTTGKRVVRIIREGFFSLLKALKLLFFPPENMTFREAAHEAIKLIVAGLAITGGIILEQYLETLLKTIPFADTISMVLIGITTGLATSLLIFLLDKLDLFGVNRDKRHDFIVQELDKMTDSSFENAEQILKSLEIRTI